MEETKSALSHWNDLKKQGLTGGPIIGFYNAVYSYPQQFINDGDDDYKESKINENTIGTIWGLFAFLAMSVGIASYSVYDMIIIAVIGLGQAEWYNGVGISGATGWQAGYLIAKSVVKGRNWWSVEGWLTLAVYLYMWFAEWKVYHAGHFYVVAGGFVVGMALHYFGPKPNPVKYLAKNSGTLMISQKVVFIAIMAICYFYLYPYQEGYHLGYGPKRSLFK